MLVRTIAISVLMTVVRMSAFAAEDAFVRMTENLSHFFPNQGELRIIEVVQTNAKGKEVKRNHLISFVASSGEILRSVIYVKEDGTMFFSEQQMSVENPTSCSWLFVPAIPGIKNSGRVFKVNQNTLRQPFIGSDFLVVDLEQLNVFEEMSYQVAEDDAIAAASKRYGQRIIRMNDDDDLAEIRYFKKSKVSRIATFHDYKDHRASKIVMTRFRGDTPYHTTTVALRYLPLGSVPDRVFDRINVEKVQDILRDSESRIP